MDLHMSTVSYDKNEHDDLGRALTKREAQIAARLADGLSYSEIARELGVSYHTVNTHVKAIYRKAGVASRARLAALMFKRRRTDA